MGVAGGICIVPVARHEYFVSQFLANTGAVGRFGGVQRDERAAGVAPLQGAPAPKLHHVTPRSVGRTAWKAGGGGGGATGRGHGQDNGKARSLGTSREPGLSFV